MDRGETFELNPVGNLREARGGRPAMARIPGVGSVYLLYRTVAPAIAQIQRSDDGGFTYGALYRPACWGRWVASTCIRPPELLRSGSNGVVAIGRHRFRGGHPAADYTIRQAAADPGGVSNLFRRQSRG